MADTRFTHAYGAVLDELVRRLRGPVGRIQILSGPRQVGKTHLLREIEGRLAGRVTYAAADVPAAALSGWWEALWQEAARKARGKRAAILMIDEIQYLPDWARRLKAEHDRIVREKIPLHVVVSGSASLTIGRGTRETMAGRFELLRLLHWPAAELARQFGIPREKAVDLLVRFGGYPGGISLVKDQARWAAYVRDAIIEPAIGRDIMAMEVIRKPALLRQVFSVAAGHPAEIVSLQKLQGRLADPGALETVAHYLQVLREAYLVAPVPKHSAKELRRRASPPKLVPLNQAFLAAVGGLVDPADDPARWGRQVENACIAHAWNGGQEVAYWRREPLEVDLVTTGSWGKWAIEVKTGAYTARDLAGILEFCRINRGYRPLVLCERGAGRAAEEAGVTAQPWLEYLLEGSPPS